MRSDSDIGILKIMIILFPLIVLGNAIEYFFVKKENLKKITGKVFKESNLPLYGATIKIRNSDVVTISEADGSFVINARTGDLLEISFIGYKTGQIKIGDEINYSINSCAICKPVCVFAETGNTGFNNHRTNSRR